MKPEKGPPCPPRQTVLASLSDRLTSKTGCVLLNISEASLPDTRKTPTSVAARSSLPRGSRDQTVVPIPGILMNRGGSPGADSIRKRPTLVPTRTSSRRAGSHTLHVALNAQTSVKSGQAGIEARQALQTCDPQSALLVGKDGFDEIAGYAIRFGKDPVDGAGRVQQRQSAIAACLRQFLRWSSMWIA